MTRRGRAPGDGRRRGRNLRGQAEAWPGPWGREEAGPDLRSGRKARPRLGESEGVWRVLWGGAGRVVVGNQPGSVTPGSRAPTALRPWQLPWPLLSGGSRRATEMASAAAPTAAVPTPAPPLEQIRHLAVELRLLLPGLRGELTPLRRATAGAGLVREEAGCGAGGGGGSGGGGGGRGGSAYLCSCLCLRPAFVPYPLVGEARETTKEFNPETFWRRLSECLSYWGLVFLIPSSVPTPFPPASPPHAPAPHLLSGDTSPYPSLALRSWGYETLIWGGVFET